MFIPKYWVRASSEVRGPDNRMHAITAWGWSGSNREEAGQKAHERLASLSNRIQMGGELQKGYGYGNRPLREEIIEEIRINNEVVAIITRNSYGSLILNTNNILFMDVDLPEQKNQEQGLIGRMFKKEKPPDQAESKLQQIRESLQGSGTGGSFRIYRTAAGFRVLATDPTFTPGSGDSEMLMKRVSTDPSFVQLCKAQQSFRARLSPKPWRCGIRVPPGQHPREETRQQQEFAKWIREYDSTCGTKATCKFIEEVGFGRVDEAARPILEMHDRLTRAVEHHPLA